MSGIPLESFRYQKSQQQRSEITYRGSIALEQYGDQSFGLELNMGKAPGSGFERSENQLVDLGPEFRGHRLLPPESVFNETPASSTEEFLLKGAEHVCFPGETTILMTNPDFTKVWEAEIESIQAGDYVVSCDLEKAGICEAGRVQAILERTVDRLVRIRVGDQVIRSTENHPFYRVETKDWVPADQLSLGDHLQSVTGSPLLVEERTEEEGETRVYNIDVEGNHNYYAGNALVHNCNIPLMGFVPVLSAVQDAACAVPLLIDCGSLAIDTFKAGWNCSESGVSGKWSCLTDGAQKDSERFESCKFKLLDFGAQKSTSLVGRRLHLPQPLGIKHKPPLTHEIKKLKKGEIFQRIRVEKTVKVEGKDRDVSRNAYTLKSTNWSQRSPKSGMTNKKRAAQGKSPYWSDGSKVELHHLNQKEPGPIVELPESFHKKHTKRLHPLRKKGDSFRNDSDLKKAFDNFRRPYWKGRASKLPD